MSSASILLHLSLIDDIGPGTVNTLLARLPASCALHDLYAMSASDITATFGISPLRAAKLVHGLADTKLLETELALIERHAISWMTIQDKNYPTLLAAIHGPPIVFYWQGAALQEADKKMAVIGARKANGYGQRAIDLIVPALVAQQWVIVSGGALGADSMAHRATLQAGGRTVAVLGSGLLKPYPSQNQDLFADIIASGGTIVSTFPLMMSPLAENFPARNRIISGLSRGCVVAQAATKSGASITAHYALEQGRDVFAVPGPIDDELSAGCHALIQAGAKLTTCAGDILQEYGELAPPMLRQASLFAAAAALQPVVAARVELPGIPGDILNICAKPTSLDDLLEQTSLPLPELNSHLFELQVMGVIEQDFAGNWYVTK